MGSMSCTASLGLRELGRSKDGGQGPHARNEDAWHGRLSLPNNKAISKLKVPFYVPGGALEKVQKTVFEAVCIVLAPAEWQGIGDSHQRRQERSFGGCKPPAWLQCLVSLA